MSILQIQEICLYSCKGDHPHTPCPPQASRLHWFRGRSCPPRTRQLACWPERDHLWALQTLPVPGGAYLWAGQGFPWGTGTKVSCSLRGERPLSWHEGVVRWTPLGSNRRWVPILICHSAGHRWGQCFEVSVSSQEKGESISKDLMELFRGLSEMMHVQKRGPS